MNSDTVLSVRRLRPPPPWPEGPSSTSRGAVPAQLREPDVQSAQSVAPGDLGSAIREVEQ